MFIKTGDRLPSWRIRVWDEDQEADLTGVESWRFVARLNGQVVFTDEPATVTVGANLWEGVAEHEWAEGETDVAGELVAEVVAIWPGDREQTFPDDKTATLTIVPSID